MSRKPQYAEYDPWSTYNPGEPVLVRAHPKRNRKVTLARALKAAEKAGVNVAGATINSEGVTLEFGNADPPASQEHTVNPWDQVLQ